MGQCRTHPLMEDDWVQILAAAYELEPEEVVEDARLVANWQGSMLALRAALRDRHGWDTSVSRYYVPALRSGPRVAG